MVVKNSNYAITTRIVYKKGFIKLNALVFFCEFQKKNAILNFGYWNDFFLYPIKIWWYLLM